ICFIGKLGGWSPGILPKSGSLFQDFLSDLRNASLDGEPACESTADRQEDCQLRLRRNLGFLGLGSVSVLVHMDRRPMVETPIL
ncbi:hypothetical protein N0457_33105, partial [Pseudomonas aeruginosa]|nr:hypothetical protein [Pseudomonas aeruginosa]